MSQPVVEVQNLGKCYVIKRQNRPDSLKELLTSNPLIGRKEPATHSEQLWALKDINFELKEGETLGIIGRNGAGKSTLLKILSRVVSPTTGKAIIRGKTASLLEVGTGFHQELSGRENVFFNGALLGMNKAEIARKFMQIVEFSEVGHFIDNPVKHYSSGMKSRLAFSVAAHLDADVMIIDEALSAGDIGFRKKATEKMKAAAFEGRSVLFVTHSMGAAEDLCDRGLYLKDGQQVMLGDIKAVIDNYVGSVSEQPSTSWQANGKPKAADNRIVPVSLTLKVNTKKATKMVVSRQDSLEVEFAIEIATPADTMSVGVAVLDEQGRRLFRMAHTDLVQAQRPKLKPGLNKFVAAIPTEFLKSGEYIVALDCDILKEGWVINPTTTEARIGFSLKEDLSTIWDPKREGIIKPRPAIREA